MNLEDERGSRRLKMGNQSENFQKVEKGRFHKSLTGEFSGIPSKMLRYNVLQKPVWSLGINMNSQRTLQVRGAISFS